MKHGKDIQIASSLRTCWIFWKARKNFAVGTANTSLGKTAKYWMIYIDIMHLHHQLISCVQQEIWTFSWHVFHII